MSGEGQEHRCPNKLLSPKKHLALNPAVNLTQDPYSVKAKENGNAGGSREGKGTLSGSILSQSDLEIKSVEGNGGKGRATTSFSLSDVSTLCPDTPDLHSTEILQESDISRLIDNVTLTKENEPGSSISALIGQFEETRDQANLTVVSPLHGSRVRSDHPPLPIMDLKMPFKHDFPKGKTKASLFCSTPERTALSPETSEHSTHTVVCETPNGSKTKLDDDPSAKAKTGGADSNLPCSSHTSHCWLPKSPTHGKDWGTLTNNSLASSTDVTLGDGIADPTLCLISGGSSLVEIEGDSENLSITTYDDRREGTSPLASPFKLKYSRDVVDHFQRGPRNGYCKATLPPPVSETFNTGQDVKSQSRSCVAYQGAGFMHKHFSSSDAKTNQTWVPPSGAHDLHAPAPKQPQQPALPALKLPSPCKSKSLGDLTSEDIACNFESKYQCISKSFVTTGIRDRKGVTVKTRSLEPMDALTEQLRRLVSLDQEDGCQVLYAKQDAQQLPRALVRKLSSRSQSRVRNIASRAKEKQEANRQRGGNPTTHVGGVVLRNKPTAPAPVGNRHSTGSYIAGYLSNAKASGLEGRGIPEGACAALHAGHADQLCSDHSVLQTEPSSDDKPEIYFLLRL